MHALLGVRPLVDRRPERVQVGEHAPLVVRYEQPNLVEPVGEAVGDACLELLDPLPRRRRELDRIREAVRDTSPLPQIEPVDLVDDQLDGDLAGADPREHGLDGVDLLGEHLLGQRAVDDVEDEIRDERLLERRREPLDELGRQTPDEADRVGDEVALPLMLEHARRRVERLEEAILDRDLCAGERVQERRLPDVRVPRERDGGRLGASARLAACRAVRARRPGAGARST